ncbi:MAG TPA: periplasmic heavy metal sensor [Thermoanaerobaculia bacterium]|nr:periplasmic heavy metal sensor [Thermoanaerobaculia bacterium]
MKRNWILGVILAVIAASTAMGRPGGPGDRGPRVNCTDALVSALSLTPDQQAALETLRQQTADAIGAIVTQEKTIHDQIDAALAAAAPDRCAIGDLVISASKLHSQIAAAVSAAEAAFVAGLTADQKTKYTAFLAANPGCSAIAAHPGGPRDGNGP